ncbi:protein phosphatase 2C domain-containing protein [Massilia glaciei]|uniref:Serine/threonine-protein phosphatase n=1 Tax=Massilia glaciei TaxID=1524097 RepID=A0A2U2HF32_9BURK|nr:protein phosphatase 2C domain-containing protein [Massilia glaciei]PWF42673.1 serine/threonine-protein phosphatase [Massilia glaciei]
MQFSVYQESQIGGRKVNQDRMGYSYTRDSLLLVLADGMGGHLRGEVAAAIAVQALSTLFQQQAQPFIKRPVRFLEEAFLVAHEEIARYKNEHNMPESPRTTLVACLVQHSSAIWAHCGDSRLYWARDGAILGRTRDHSHIEHLIAKGLADPSERATHPDRNKLYNCLGANSLPQVDISRQAALQPGDVLLLCSDGLWSMLPEDDILRALSTQTIVRAVPDMLNLAVLTGGDKSDNATALAIMWQGNPETGVADAPGVAPNVISTQMLAEDQSNSTILGGAETVTPSDIVDEFGDDEIEKAIAEIREAIERSSQAILNK